MTGPDFAGSVADHYLSYRRDVPADLAARIVAAFELGSGDVVCDLGCGTGQVVAPLAPHVGAVVAVDPEPDMLEGLRTRRLEHVVPVAGRDVDLDRLAAEYGPFAAVTVGNALHWMDEPAVIAAARAAVRPGGGLAIVTQGPPLWLADTDWSRALRTMLESHLGPLSSTCGTDDVALEARTSLVGRSFRRVQIVDEMRPQGVDADWVIGHLRSAMSPADEPDEFEHTVRATLASFRTLVEPLRVTIVLGTR